MSDLAISLIDTVDISAIQATMQKINTFQGIVRQTLKDGHDYGIIPGVQKPSLYKPGGEKICMLFGVNPEYDFMTVTEDYQSEFFSYNIKCTLFKNSNAVAQGVGSCNSKEKKYRFINVDELPEGYVGISEQITTRYGQIKYKIENNDTCSLVNTILKMAKKRAFVDAVLQLASLSEVFTQDVEDMENFIQAENKAAASTMTPEQAGAVIVRFGKHKNKSLKGIYKEDKGYLDWLISSDKTDATIKKAIEIMFNAVKEKQSTKQQSSVSEESNQADIEKESEAVFFAPEDESIDLGDLPFDNGDFYDPEEINS